MSNRREFLRAGAFAASAMAGTRAFADTDARAARSTSSALSLYTVVFDDRFAESSAFAAQARLKGLRTQGLDRGDVTRLWYDDLYHRWQEGPAAIAGLTTPDALFVLETFGNDAGLRLQFKAEHRTHVDRVEHRLYGPERMLRSALSLESSGSRWSSQMGRLVSASRARDFGRSEASLTTDLSSNLPTHRNMLVSWVLAPRVPRAVSALQV